jgi:hypothetical protein
MIELKSAKLKNQKGIALVMTLLILSLMMVSVTALSRIIIGEVKMAVNTTNSMAAYYAADSAIEKSLYYIKYARKYGDDTPLNSLYDKYFYMIDSEQSFYFSEVATSNSGHVNYDVTPSSPAHVDIVDLAGDLGTIDWGSATPDTYRLDWLIEDCFPFHASDRLEVTKYSFNATGLSDVDKDIVICNCTFGDVSCDNTLSTYPILGSNFYRLVFRPLDSTAESITFNVYDSGASVISIPSQVAVTADGIYKNAKYRLKVEIPTLGALSDVFSYVIFSEEALIKNL